MKSAGINSDNKGEKMTGKIFTQEKDGFIGARCGAGWVIARGCHALAMSAGRKEREIS